MSRVAIFPKEVSSEPVSVDSLEPTNDNDASEDLFGILGASKNFRALKLVLFFVDFYRILPYTSAILSPLETQKSKRKSTAMTGLHAHQ